MLRLRALRKELHFRLSRVLASSRASLSAPRDASRATWKASIRTGLSLATAQRLLLQRILKLCSYASKLWPSATA